MFDILPETIDLVPTELRRVPEQAFIGSRIGLEGDGAQISGRDGRARVTENLRQYILPIDAHVGQQFVAETDREVFQLLV